MSVRVSPCCGQYFVTRKLEKCTEQQTGSTPLPSAGEQAVHEASEAAQAGYIYTELKIAHLDDAPDVSGNAESGWASVAKAIREVDEEKVRDYKEDIDTILVFVSSPRPICCQARICSTKIANRLVCTLPSCPHCSWKHTKACNRTRTQS